MADDVVLIERPAVGIAHVILNRPEARNAVDDGLLDGLTKTFKELGDDRNTRAIVLRSSGPAFCAGADLNWMARIAVNTGAEALRLQIMLRTIDECPKLTIAAVDGAAFAGGIGLVSVCDVVIATARAKFCLSEVKLGLAPAITAAFLLHRVGPGQLRYFGSTAAVVAADRAHQLGLVDIYVESAEELTRAVEEACAQALEAEPAAVASLKKLVAEFTEWPEARHEIALRAFVQGRLAPAVEEGLWAIRARERPSWSRARD